MAKSEPITTWGGPTKRFFVSMLPRDIELKDAILDLVDNCIDGATRQITKQKLRTRQAYDGFEARLRIDGKSFEISDNCGGIPKDRIATHSYSVDRRSKRVFRRSECTASG